MTELTIISPEEARDLLEAAASADSLDWCRSLGWSEAEETSIYEVVVTDEGRLPYQTEEIANLIASAPDLAHTAAVLGEENAALREQVAEQAAALARVEAETWRKAAESLHTTAAERGCLDEFPCWCDKADQFEDSARAALAGEQP